MKNWVLLLALICLCGCPMTARSDEPEHSVFYQGPTRGVRFAWAGNPQKRPIIFVHGSPGGWEGWGQFLSDPELQKNFHLIAVDRPGFGGSDEGHEEPSIELQAADIIDALKFNESGLPAILVGHSYGGPVIARMAMDFPDDVAGLVFVAAAVEPGDAENSWYQQVEHWWPVRAFLKKDWKASNEESLVLQSELKKMLPYWNDIHVPVVLIQGQADSTVSPVNQDFLKQKIQSQYIVKSELVPDEDHDILWKRPDLTIDGIKKISQNLGDSFEDDDDYDTVMGIARTIQ